ncbi:N-acetylgalactosamine kinase, partial [Ophiophagus hannah]
LLKLKNRFISKFKTTPKFYVRAPGRVNLIGEHIDYCGYAVLPMAIDQDILIAAQPLNSPILHLANTDSSYSDFNTDANDIQIQQTKPSWHNYFLCGFKGIQDRFNLRKPSGINCLVEGTIPPSSGLSSSSALVCCAALATLVANGKTLSKAKLIEFNPLKATNVKLPGGAVFVIANSCVEMNKAATSHFNIRVMECRLATKLLAKSRGLDWRAVSKLQDVQTKLKLSLEEMLAVVEEAFHPEPYSLEEIGGNLGISPTELRTQILSQNTQDVTNFKLYQRAKHVYAEAARVLEFKDICVRAPDDAISLLGDLMNQSHASCRDLYECSCPELDQLVDICLQFGAVGSRLTGAGWGGCTVSMVPVDKLERFLANVKEAYYRNNGQRLALEENSLFATNPGAGAVIVLEA